MDAAVDGDTVLLSPGTYAGEGNKNVNISYITLALLSTSEPEECVIDCEGDGRSLLVENDSSKTLYFRGLTFKNGAINAFTQGSAIHFTPSEPDDGHCIINSCIFENNYSQDIGGALYMGNTSLEISECVFIGNGSAISGGAIYSGSSWSSAVIEDSVFFGNYAWTGAVISGSASHTIEFTRCLFTNNHWGDQYYGSAFDISLYVQYFNMSDCELYGDNRFLFLGTEDPYYSSVADISNCLLTGSSLSIDAWGHTWDVYISNCTIVDNGLGMTSSYSSTWHITDSIIRDNAEWQVHGNAEIQYSNIGGGFPGDGNIDADPQFVTGSYGDYYLSQTSSGQASDSACLNAGSDLASDICFAGEAHDYCMLDRTTRTDSGTDSWFVDMGYHYPVDPTLPTPSVTPTPTVTPTPSITPTPTQTPTPSNTPTMTPTDTPTLTPTVTPTMTSTQIASPTLTVMSTSTPTQTATPTSTPTSTPVFDTTHVTLDMPSDYYRPGDPCYCTVTICNAEESPLTGYPLFVVLDVYGALFWGPGFTEEIDSYLADYPEFPENETVVTVIPEFTWPNITASAAGIRFIAALTNPEISNIIGEMDTFSFGWGN